MSQDLQAQRRVRHRLLLTRTGTAQQEPAQPGKLACVLPPPCYPAAGCIVTSRDVLHVCCCRYAGMPQLPAGFVEMVLQYNANLTELDLSR